MGRIAQLRRLGLFDTRVPRYTSYPSSPHFSPDVGAGEQDSWLRAIPEGGEISLYVHVPFCRRLCWFCACRTQGVRSDDPVEAYLGTLLKELALVAERLPDGVRLSRLHWGGGTPTLLRPAMIETLAQAIRDVAPFADDAEFSVEIDPNEVDGDRIRALSEAGMNRASIGVQDFDPVIQKTIGREQTYETTRQVVEMLRAAGIESLNADILYGLPHQTPSGIAETVQMLLTLTPDRVALYGYAHVPWMARRQTMIPEEHLPEAEARLDLFETARNLFLWDGYAEIGIDHFARPGDGLENAARTGRLRRNFQGYTDDTAPVLVGIGASAISRFPQGYVQNASGTADYQRRVRGGELAGVRGHAFTDDDRFRARMIEALMCDFEIDRAEIEALGADRALLSRLFTEAAAAFPGMVEVDERRFRILPEGRPLTRMVARSFDAYDSSRARHSAAF